MAYYFIRENPEHYSNALCSCFKSTLGAATPVDTFVHTGELIYRSYTSQQQQKEILDFLKLPPDWLWYYPSQMLLKYIENRDNLCIVFRSIAASARDQIHQQLVNAEPLYLGASQVLVSLNKSWLLHQGLSLSFRIANKNIYQLVPPGTLEINDRGSIDDWQLDEFRRIGFIRAEPQEMGIRYSPIDPFNNYDHELEMEEAVLRLSRLLPNLAELVESAIVRIDGFDSRLGMGFASAFERILSHNADAYRHAASTCRAVMAFFADAVFPPNEKTYEGHKVDKQSYKNRLIAHATRSLKRDSADNDTQHEVIDRIQRIYDLGNRGDHEILGKSLTMEDTNEMVFDLLFLIDRFLPSPSEAYLSKDDLERILETIDPGHTGPLKE